MTRLKKSNVNSAKVFPADINMHFAVTAVLFLIFPSRNYTNSHKVPCSMGKKKNLHTIQTARVENYEAFKV